MPTLSPEKKKGMGRPSLSEEKIDSITFKLPASMKSKLLKIGEKEVMDVSSLLQLQARRAIWYFERQFGPIEN